MAGFTLLALLDDISTVLDDVALLTKMAAQKTAGVVGDDLALTAEGLSGLRASRELPVVYAVSKGSLVNKLILIPLALLISSLAPFLIGPLLMAGGAYLCQEGAEKVYELLLRLFGKSPGHHLSDHLKELPDPYAEGDVNSAEKEDTLPIDPLLFEKRKIKGAIRTDFVLSAEIITIALGVIPRDISLLARAGTLVLVGLVMTIGVYGFVALIVKLDDLGYLFLGDEKRGKLKDFSGRLLVGAAPYIMRVLAIVGTIAMFLVGGTIIFHHLPVIGDAISDLGLLAYPANIGLGLAVGFLILPIVIYVEKMIVTKKTEPQEARSSEEARNGSLPLGNNPEADYSKLSENLEESMRLLADEIFHTQEKKVQEIEQRYSKAAKTPDAPGA
jgi:predicted DNA repair protein MutK